MATDPKRVLPVFWEVLPVFWEAVKAGATVGEISDVLRSVWGEHQETVTI